jgi:hypothetical protein
MIYIHIHIHKTCHVSWETYEPKYDKLTSVSRGTLTTDHQDMSKCLISQFFLCDPFQESKLFKTWKPVETPFTPWKLCISPINWPSTPSV